MKSKNYLNLFLIIGILITIYGLITGRFFFLFLVIPLGVLFNHTKKIENKKKGRHCIPFIFIKVKTLFS